MADGSSALPPARSEARGGQGIQCSVETVVDRRKAPLSGILTGFRACQNPVEYVENVEKFIKEEKRL